jgi:serine phosphatase RsbU (regulator of sigma subunit)
MTPPKANILLVDDTPGNLVVLEAVLEGLGQRLVKAHSGAQALKCLLDDDFALILMDAQMPVMDGFETAALIRQRERSRHTPIIFITAYEVTQVQMFKGYSVGAVDFLFKPIIPAILRSKVAVFVDLFRKTEEIKHQADLLRESERREHEQQLLQQQRHYQAEQLREKIRFASEIQQHLFPAAPPRCTGFDIHGASYAAETIGGDYFDYIDIEGGSVGIAIGDVCGHGFGPALLMAATRAYLRALALTRMDVGDILTLTNQALAADLTEGHFVTLLLAQLQPETASLTYVNAGHPAGYLLSAQGEVKAILSSTACPLGISDARLPHAPALVLEPGEVVLLFTDGLVEATDPGKNFFGVDRALDIIRKRRRQSAEEIVAALYNDVRDFAGHQENLDDITAIVIKRESQPA